MTPHGIPSATALELADERRERELEDRDLRAGLDALDGHLRRQDEILATHTRALDELRRGALRILLCVAGALASGIAALAYDIIRSR